MRATWKPAAGFPHGNGPTRMSREGTKWMDQWFTVVNGIFHLLINSVYIGVISCNPLIRTIDPNFLPKGHPSSWIKPGSLPLPEMVPEMVDFLGLPFLFAENISSLKTYIFCTWKIGGWKMMWLPFLGHFGLFSGELAVSFQGRGKTGTTNFV